MCSIYIYKQDIAFGQTFKKYKQKQLIRCYLVKFFYYRVWF